jgi:tRNA (adenine22-N1)-methyltransferase
LLELLVPCRLLVDVGTDHGLVPVAAVRRGVADRAIAVDVREAPLAGARALIERSGVGGRVVAAQGDGLSRLSGRGVDAVVVAGMSGASVLRILEMAPDVLAGVAQLVLQPNQNVRSLRRWALQNRWHLRDEHVLEERGQFFVTCGFVPGAGRDPVYSVPGWTVDALCDVGPRLLTRRDPAALRWFERQRARTARWLQRDPSRLQPQLELWDAACEAMRA